MSRASRLLELLELLRRRRAPVSGMELAQQLGVSLRTLYRDIVTLQAQGADIRGEPGLGYVLCPGFTLPPLMFSADELQALVLGSRWVAVRGDGRLSAAAEDAMAKIRAVLPSELRESIDEAILTVPVLGQSEHQQVDTTLIRNTIRLEQKLLIDYRDAEGRVTQRTVWPFLIGYFERALVLAAWCELRGDFRAFRVDRIARAEKTGQAYPRRRVELVRQWRLANGIAPTDRN